MDSWILAHGSGVDDILVFAFTSALVLAIRMIVTRRPPEDPEEPAMSEHHPGEVEDDERAGLDDPASSHGSDLDPRTGTQGDQSDPATGAAQPPVENR